MQRVYMYSCSKEERECPQVLIKGCSSQFICSLAAILFEFLLFTLQSPVWARIEIMIPGRKRNN